MSENLLQTEDKYSAMSFGFAPNRWHVTNDEKSCVLSVNDEYNYSKLLELYNAIEVDKREAIAWAVIGKKEFALSDGELTQIKQDTADTLARLRAVTQKINSVWVRRMNNVRNRAEEIVLHELVYEESVG